MNRVTMLREMREQVWETEGWFPSLSQALEGLTAAEAAWQPPGGGNTIWQTLSHMTYYNARILHRIKGTDPGQGPPDNDATFGGSGNPSDAEGWAALVERTRQVAAGLKNALAELSEADLERPLSQGTLGDTLRAWVGHDAYHTGQIVLLRKQQGSWPAHRG